MAAVTPPEEAAVERSDHTYLPAPLSSGRGSRCGPQQPRGVNWEHWSYWSSGSSACPLSLALVPARKQTDGLSNRIKSRLLRADFHILSSNILWLRVYRIWVHLGVFFIIPKLQEKVHPFDEHQKVVPFVKGH